MFNRLITFVATGFCWGYLRPFPGTWGTIPAWLIAFFLIRGDLRILLAVTVVSFFISVWSSTAAEKTYGRDARMIVIDEWAGMFVTLLLVPFSLTNYAIAFFAFRFFDVVKLPPAAQSEKLRGGWGVTMDDIVAGVYANLATQIAIRVIARYFGG
ncbi:MAG: phosphatidylglycerophosphatase A [Candidatus Zixiibacteriota bacterium]|nr:MAG: phosphatidylglycerophosphatase A [candidate division Zixibacteria bacterium]